MDRFVEERVEVPFGTRTVDAALCVPSAPQTQPDTAFILTHGAGGDMNSRQLVSLARAVASGGSISLRFTCRSLNLGYRVKVYRAVWEFLKSMQKFHINHIFIGGRSMGSRAAAALARQLSVEAEDGIQGLVCLSFPLHPPAQTQSHHQRSEDLLALPKQTPVLFVSGTEDNMCERTLMDQVVERMEAEAEVFWLEGGSHGLTVKGRTEDSVLDELNLQVITWLRKIVK